MTEHDPMCPQYDQTERTIAMFDTPCRCEEYARVRADERERIAADIEALAVERNASCVSPQDAARIARGES